MFGIDNATSVASEPSRPAAGTAGYFTSGDAGAGTPPTILPSWWCNMIQKELLYVVETIGGLTADKADDTQLGTVLGPIRALQSAAADTGVASTSHLRALLASFTSQAKGASSAVVAGSGCIVEGGQSLIAASGGATIGLQSTQSAIIACLTDCSTSDDQSALLACRGTAGVVANHGKVSAIVASEDSTIVASCTHGLIAACQDSHLGTTNPPAWTAAIASVASIINGNGGKASIIASNASEVSGSGTECAVIASDTCTVQQSNTATLAATSTDVLGGVSAGIASTSCTLTGGTSATLASGSCTTVSGASRVAVVGSTSSDADGTNAGIMASTGATTDGTQTAVVASDGGDATGTNAAVVASHDAQATGAEAAAIACGAGTGATTVAGDHSAAIACEDSSVHADAERCAALAALTCAVDGADSACVASKDSNTASGAAQALVAASRFGTASGVQAAVIASAGDSSTGDDVVTSGNRSAAIGCGSGAAGARVVGSNSILLGSVNCELADDYTIGGGWAASAPAYDGADNKSIKWTISSNTGDAWFGGDLECAGDLTYAGTLTDSMADFAELFENASPGAIPAGLLMAREGRRVRVAGKGDYAIGPVSLRPALLGNATKERRQRPNLWTPVALTGQVPIRVDETVTTDSIVVAGAGGIGTDAPNHRKRGARIEVLEIVEPFDASRGYGVALCLVR